MHCTLSGKTFTKSESSSKWKQALRYQTRTSSKIKESSEKVKIYVIIAGISPSITTDVVEYYIPFWVKKP